MTYNQRKPGRVYMRLAKKASQEQVGALTQFIQWWLGQVPEKRASDVSGKITLGGDEYWFNGYFQIGQYGPEIKADVGDKVEQAPSGHQAPGASSAAPQPAQQGYTPPSPPNYRSSPGPQQNTEPGDPGPASEDAYGPFGAG